MVCEVSCSDVLSVRNCEQDKVANYPPGNERNRKQLLCVS